ncbi:CBS domain-containing protein [Borborobacter arsenicus]|nr:CBS domain-containing protein [Pseudaminobacter arsenicus]
MTTATLTVTPQTLVADAARLMLEHRVSGLPVIDKDGALVGIVTERDLLCRPEIGTAPRHANWINLWLTADESAEEYAQSRGRKVGDVMTRQVFSVAPDTSLHDITALMVREGVKRLPVTQDGKVMGMVSRADFLRPLLGRLDNVQGPRAEDITIRREILREISGKRWSPRPVVDVSVCDGIVELTGSVASERVRAAIRVAAENTSGVKQVITHLRLASGTSGAGDRDVPSHSR